jgi:hypothetical protein
MVKCAKIDKNEDFQFVASTTKWGRPMETDSLYCKACKSTEDSVHGQNSESLLVKVQSDTKIESPKQASLIPKHLRHELTDDFFDEFSNDSSDDSEEYNSEDNSGVVPTPLWWFDACKEISLSSVEECKLFSSACKKFSCKKLENDEGDLDHGNGDFKDQSGNGEDENGDNTTSGIDHQVSLEVALWDFPSDSDHLLWNSDRNGESSGNNGNHNNNDMSEITNEETFFYITIGGPDRTAKLPGEPQEPPVGEAKQRYLH